MLIFPCWWIEDNACACPDGVECGNKSGKHPLTRNGVKDATDDAEQIAAWRAEYPHANWGIATGNGLLVLDLDVKPGKNGIESIKTLGALPATRTVRTGSGGLHFYFSVDRKLPNTSGKLGPGIDTRCDGGYVLAPGSGHLSGGTYSLALDRPVAPAPTWLVDMLSTSDAPPVAASDRGFFGPATPDVIAAARSALDRHGPAIEGSGGDMHTWRAAALLLHDFALTEDEAWPLLVEWNEECQPPWNTGPLRTKLRGGLKYGRSEFGCKRPFNAVESAKRALRSWGGDEGKLKEVLDHVRICAERSGDTALRELILKEAVDVTGMKAKALNLPMPRLPAVELPHGVIEVSTRVHEVADHSLVAITPHVFQRNGVLCEVVKAERTFIHDLDVAGIQDLMSRHATFMRKDESESVAQVAPIAAAQILGARRIHPGVRVLEAISTAPVFLADGSILFERGYNEQARVFLEPSVDLEDTIVPSPSLVEARESVAVFQDLLCDFDFHDEADFSSWLAGLLSPLVKAATGNAPAPLVCISASSPGAGKTLLSEVIARIVTGQGAEVRPYNCKDASEWGKRLTAFVKAATPVNVFDNVNGPIGDEGLDRLITSTTWSDRQLGASDAPPLPVVGCWYATGNNIEPINDTVRRVLMVRIEVDTERPQERTGFKRPLLAEYALEHRASLLAAALTILRAYHCAGRPDMDLPSWGSFTAWSSLVRGSLVWSGLPDPFKTQQRANRELSEPDEDAHDFWVDVINASDSTPADIAAKANQRDAQAVLGLRESITPLYLRRFINRFVDKPRAGRRIRRERARYWVEQIA